MSELTDIADKAIRKSRKGIKAVEPYGTKELSDIIEQVTMGFETVKQFMKEVSIFMDFEAEEFITELQDTITELEKHF